MKKTSLNPGDFLDVASFHNGVTANKLKSALESHGMEVRLNDESKLQRFWFMAPQQAGIHVQVRRKDFMSARKIVDEMPARSDQSGLQCPSCGSLRVQFPALTRKNILPGFIGWLLAVLHVTRHKYYCEDCHYTWPQQEPDSQPRDLLGW